MRRMKVKAQEKKGKYEGGAGVRGEEVGRKKGVRKK